MSTKYKFYGLYVMVFITLLLVAGIIMYLSYSVTTEEAYAPIKISYQKKSEQFQEQQS